MPNFVNRSDSDVFERSKSGMLATRNYTTREARGSSPSADVNVDFEAITKYFLGFWRAPHAARALSALEKYESKRMLKPLHKKYGQWSPPPEIAQALKKPPQPHVRSHLPDTKDARNLQFVLKMLGCSLHQNRPYKQFVKAKTVRQKRLWMYKYMTPKSEISQQNKEYTEPICPTRLRRLFQFFPDRFREQNGSVYFNNKIIMYDDSKKVFYVGLVPSFDYDDNSE